MIMEYLYVSSSFTKLSSNAVLTIPVNQSEGRRSTSFSDIYDDIRYLVLKEVANLSVTDLVNLADSSSDFRRVFSKDRHRQKITQFIG